jgi:hypothetical protein
MKNTYRVERMTTENYHNFMGGSYCCNVEYLDIEAETAEEAVEMAKAEGYVVNKNYVKTVEELEAIKKAQDEAWRAKEEKAERAKAKRKETEARKAVEAGMTVEEYRKEKARKAKIARLEKEIAELEEKIARQKAYLAKLKG